MDVDRELPFERAQELKEAVCDAVIERTRRVVSGEGGFGSAIYGRLPSHALTSGFIVPRMSTDGADEEANDIRLPLHGLDLRLDARATGEVRIRPRFSVYLRSLPSADEVFSPSLGLRPRAEFNARARELIKDRMAASRGRRDHQGMTPAERNVARRALVQAAWTELGVTGHSAHAREEVVDPEDVPGDANDGERIRPAAVIDDVVGNVRIPDRWSVRHEIPEKYTRLAVDAPELTLPLPYRSGEWAVRVDTYAAELNAAIDRTVVDWLGSPDGRSGAWRKAKVAGSDFWTREAWEACLETLRRQEPVAADLLPGMEVKAIVDAMIDPFDPGVLTARIAIENFRRGNDFSEQGLFQVSLRVTTSPSALVWMQHERIKRSYQFAGLLRVPAIGVNGGVEHRGVQPDGDGPSHDELTTTWMPRFVLRGCSRPASTAFPCATTIWSTRFSTSRRCDG